MDNKPIAIGFCLGLLLACAIAWIPQSSSWPHGRDSYINTKFNSSGYLTLDADDQILFGTNVLAISGTNIQYNGRSL